MAEREPRRRRSWSLWIVLRFGLVLIALLLMNSFLVKSFVDNSTVVADDLRITQTLQFGLPIVMIFIEFWIYDMLKRAAFQDIEA